MPASVLFLGQGQINDNSAFPGDYRVNYGAAAAVGDYTHLVILFSSRGSATFGSAFLDSKGNSFSTPVAQGSIAYPLDGSKPHSCTLAYCYATLAMSIVSGDYCTAPLFSGDDCAWFAFAVRATGHTGVLNYVEVATADGTRDVSGRTAGQIILAVGDAFHGTLAPAWSGDYSESVYPSSSWPEGSWLAGAFVEEVVADGTVVVGADATGAVVPNWMQLIAVALNPPYVAQVDVNSSCPGVFGIQGALVTLNTGETAYTDVNGVAEFDNLATNTTRTFTVSHADYPAGAGTLTWVGSTQYATSSVSLTPTAGCPSTGGITPLEPGDDGQCDTSGGVSLASLCADVSGAVAAGDFYSPLVLWGYNPFGQQLIPMFGYGLAVPALAGGISTGSECAATGGVSTASARCR